MTTVQDKAEELLHLLYGVGQANLVAFTASASASQPIDLDTPDIHSVAVVTFDGATPIITLPTPGAIGQKKRAYFIQPAGGNVVPSFAGATVTWMGVSAFTFQTGDNAVDRIDFESLNGTTWVGSGWQATTAASGSFASLLVTGNATIDGTLAVDEAATLASAVITAGATVGTTLAVSGTTTAVAITASGLVTANDGLTVATGKAVSIAGTTTLTVGTGATILGGTLAVTGAVTLSSTLASGALTVTGAATVSTTLGVTGNLTVGADVTVTASTGAIACGPLTVTGAASVSTTLTVTGLLTASDALTVTTGTTTLGGNLAVTGEVGLNGKTPVGLATTYTQTYSTAARVIPAATFSPYTQTSSNTGVTNSSAYGFTTAAELEYLVTDIAGIITQEAALAADALALKKLIVAIVQDITAVGIAT